MRTKLTLWVGAILLSTGHLFAANNTAVTAAVVRPDGSAVTEDFNTAGGLSAWFSAPLTAGHSYIAEVEAPFDGIGSLLAGASPALTLAITRSDGTTAVVSSDISACAPATGATGRRRTFTPSAADVGGGPIKVSVTNASVGGTNYAFRFRLYESGLSCPRWSVNGYQCFVNLQNTSDCPVNATVIFYRQDGSVASTTPVALPANGAMQLAYPASVTIGGVVYGSSAVFHDGAKGAVTGGIYQVNNAAAGANYLWSYVEIRSSGSTSGQ